MGNGKSILPSLGITNYQLPIQESNCVSSEALASYSD
jgi:hypothetical protein